MNILFVCHRLPFPPKRGGKIRPFNIIRHLTSSGHRVTVASLARSDDELQEGQGLKDYCADLHVGRVGKIGALLQMVLRLPTPGPSSMGYFYSRALHRSVNEALASQKFDLVFVHCSSVAQYVRNAHGITSVIDFGDMDSQKWLDYSTFKPFPLSWGYFIEGSKLAREEKRLARKFSLSTCTTRLELDTLRSFDAAQKTAWFPNGVDSEFFAPADKPYDPDEICFIGRMDYYPNQQAMLWFCEQVLPLLQQRRSALRLSIIGAEPSREILRLGDLPGVTVTGTVPDVRDYVRNAALSVAPLFIARGTQNKILESMAMGVPVVCSEMASAGVDAVSGQDLLTATTPDEYVAAISRILDDAQEREKFSRVGRERVLSHHSWPRSMQKLDGILADFKGSP